MDDVISKGTATQQAFEVLGTQEIQHMGKQVRLIKLCNPWEFFEWEGDFSVRWAGWTPELRSMLDYPDN